MASALRTRTRFAYRLLPSLLLTQKPQIFTSLSNLSHADILYHLRERPFHLGASPAHSTYKTSSSVSCDLASTIIWSRASFSTQSISTNEPVVSVDQFHDNLPEPDTKELDAAPYILDEQGSSLQEYQVPKNCSDVLRAWGCTDNEISQIFQRMPSLHKANLTNLQSKLNVLHDLGFTSSDLIKIVTCRPRFLKCRINQSFNERIHYLESLFGSKEILQKAILRNPSLLTYDLQNDIIRVVDLYDSLGISKEDLTAMLLSRPTIIPRTSLDDEKLEYIRRTGVAKDSKMYKYVVTLVAISRVETIREKIANLEKFGFSEDEVFRLLGDSPLVLTLSVDKVQRNMTFILGIMKLPATQVLSHPFLLSVNLEAVLKPRMILASKIEDKGLVPQMKQSALLTALRMTEKRFIKAYINCHPENVAKELMDYYTDAKHIKRLAQSSKKKYHKGFPF